MRDFVPRDVAEVVPAEFASGTATDVAALAHWLFSDDAYRHPSVREWLGFLAVHHTIFTTIYHPFIRANPGDPNRKDFLTAATSPDETLAIANVLYISKSHGIEGTVLECGCYKGFSSCCLSYACTRLGYPLVVADSFAGLPPSPTEVGTDMYYQAGDFAGSRREVEQNLRTFGLYHAVEFLEGWFSDTLKNWQRPLALIWMDVDLDSSATDVILPCLPHLHPAGVIFSHEFMDGCVQQGKVIGPCGPPGIVATAVEELDPNYRAAFLCNNLGTIGRTQSAGVESYDLLKLLIPQLHRLGGKSSEPSSAAPSLLGRVSRKVRSVVLGSKGG